MTDKQKKETKKRMKTGKKALWTGIAFCIALITFCCFMIIAEKDTQTVAIFGGAGVAAIPLLFNIYEKHSNEINLMHMEKGYDPNYDEKNGLY